MGRWKLAKLNLGTAVCPTKDIRNINPFNLKQHGTPFFGQKVRYLSLIILSNNYEDTRLFCISCRKT